MTRSVDTKFDRDTAVLPLSEGRFQVALSRDWWIVRGPNGGYIAAILTRAIHAAVDDPERGLRSLTVHYLRPPEEGEAEILVAVERSGRSLSTVTARLMQQGKVQAIAIAALSKPRQSHELHQAVMPEVTAPRQLHPRSANPAIPMHAHYDERPAIGSGPWSEPRSKEALTGGWIRLAEGRTLDDALLVAYSDAWAPAVFAHKDLTSSMGVPTIDLTVHVLATLPASVGPEDFVLMVFRTREVSEGFLEEDGEIWSEDGILLAQVRQLAVMM